MKAQKLAPIFVLMAWASWVGAAMDFKEADITTIKNIVEKNEGTGAVPAQVNDKIHENSKVTTSAASMAELTFADSSITRMGANTQFSFQSKERLIKLEQGTVLIHTPPGNGGATVDCGGVTAAVTGTTFMASHDSVGNVMFVLLEGQGGLRVTVGGSSKVILPGQAASVGAEVKKEAVGKDSSASPGVDKPASTGENKGSADGGATPSKNSSSTPSSGGDENAGSTGPASTPAPKIQVFDVDVKKIVTTTPLIVEFKNELPSTAKIDKVIETQQTKVQEGKIEKTDTEIVLIKHEDGDILVGAPKVNAEETVVINRKEDVIGVGNGGKDNLDVETAAGPGVGGGETPMASAAPPRVESPAANSNPPPAPPVNQGQIAVQQPNPPTVIAVTAKVNDASRPFNQPNPAFGFSITAGSLLPGHSLVTSYLTPAIAGSGVAGGPYAVNFSNPRIVDVNGADVSRRYNLTTLAGVLNVTKAPQNVSFGPVGSLVFGQAVDLVASALSGPVNVEVVSGPASVVNGKLVANSGTGTVVVRASAPGNENYLGASAEKTINLTKAQQSILFSQSPDTLVHMNGDLLEATSSGSGPISYELVSGPGTVSKIDPNLFPNPDPELIGKYLVWSESGTGQLVVRASSPGDQNYLPATIEKTITLSKADGSITFNVPSNLSYGFTLNSSGQPLASSIDGNIPTVSIVSGPGEIDAQGNFRVKSGTGTILIRATVPGNDNYKPITVEKTISLIKATQPIYFPTLFLGYNSDLTPWDLSKEVSTGPLPLSYELVDPADASKASINGSMLRVLSGTGIVKIRAFNPGDSNYEPVSAVQTINLGKAPQEFKYSMPDFLTFGTSTNLGWTVTGGGDVTYELVNPADSRKVSISGAEVRALSGTGTVDIRIATLGNENYQDISGIWTFNLVKAFQALDFGMVGPRLTGSSGSISVSGGEGITPTLYIVETDGRATADSTGVVTVGKVLGADSFTLIATAAGNDNYMPSANSAIVSIAPDLAAILQANPARRLLSSPEAGDELTALDQFFYYTGKVAGTTGPETFYQTDHQNPLDLANLGSSAQLFQKQTANYFFGSRLEAAQASNVVNLAGKDSVIYAKKVSLGSVSLTAPVFSTSTIKGDTGGEIPDGNAAGLASSKTTSQAGSLPYAVRLNLAIDPSTADAFLGDYVAYLRHTSADGLNTRTVKLFEHIGATTEFPEGSAGTGLSVLMSDWATDSIAPQDPAGILTGSYRPGVTDQLVSLNDLGAFDASGIWTLWVGDTSPGGTGKLTSWSVELEQLLQPTTVVDLVGGAGQNVTLAAGSEGLAVNSTWIKANQAKLEFLSTGSMEMRGTQIEGVGSQFLAEAVGPVKMGAQSTPVVPSPSVETVDREQVRILADTVTDAGGVAVAPPGSMAVIRTGDSLELRNVTIRNFSETRLEKVNPTTKALQGRVLISGSAVRDFKIKELVGAAVNADAKIQMAAIDGNGALAGDMVVEGGLPVATKLAKEIDNTITGTLGDTAVHAKSVELAARNLNFNGASIAAMESITARANTILVQNSFMTVVRASGMINMYVSSGMVNPTYGTMMDGRVNFAGSNAFQFGSVAFNISSPADLSNAYGTKLFDTQNGAGGKIGAINVLRL